MASQAPSLLPIMQRRTGALMVSPSRASQPPDRSPRLAAVPARLLIACGSLCRAYLQQLNKYRQRVWSCKYTGASGLTYEEAILSEQRVGLVVEQVGLSSLGQPWQLDLGRPCCERRASRAKGCQQQLPDSSSWLRHLWGRL